MPTARIPTRHIFDGSLPNVCVICGEPATHKRYANVRAPSPAWVLAFPIVGLIAFWSSVARLPPETRPPKGLPFCDRHLNYWRRRGKFVVYGFLLGVVIVVVGMAAIAIFGNADDSRSEVGTMIAGLGCCLWMPFLPTFIVLPLFSFRPTGGDRNVLVCSGAHKYFVEALMQRESDQPPPLSPPR